MGICMVVGLLIYAIVLAVVLSKGPPVETSAQQTTSQRSKSSASSLCFQSLLNNLLSFPRIFDFVLDIWIAYTLDISCVGLSAHPRDLEGNFE